LTDLIDELKTSIIYSIAPLHPASPKVLAPYLAKTMDFIHRTSPGVDMKILTVKGISLLGLKNSLQDEEPQAEMEKVVYLSLPNLGIEMVK
jgi:hypothetical protein